MYAVALKEMEPYLVPRRNTTPSLAAAAEVAEQEGRGGVGGGGGGGGERETVAEGAPALNREGVCGEEGQMRRPRSVLPPSLPPSLPLSPPFSIRLASFIPLLSPVSALTLIPILPPSCLLPAPRASWWKPCSPTPTTGALGWIWPRSSATRNSTSNVRRRGRAGASRIRPCWRGGEEGGWGGGGGKEGKEGRASSRSKYKDACLPCGCTISSRSGRRAGGKEGGRVGKRRKETRQVSE
jgi:hypothetical protein